MNGELASSAGCSVSQVRSNSARLAAADERARLAARVPENHGNRRRERRRVRIERIARQRAAVGDGAQIRGRPARGRELRRGHGRRIAEPVRGHGQCRQQLPRVRRGRGRAAAGDLLAAHRDHAVEEPAAPRASPSAWRTSRPPPDCPKMVTQPASPPNSAALSRTHCSARTRSRMPTLPESA